MLRAILLNRWADHISGAAYERHQTIDFDCQELEKALSRGGYGENGHDCTNCIGIEILPEINNVENPD